MISQTSMEDPARELLLKTEAGKFKFKLMFKLKFMLRTIRRGQHQGKTVTMTLWRSTGVLVLMTSTKEWRW